MSLSEFPPEMLFAILVHLRGDNISLRACALTCTAWVAPAQAQIFHTLNPDILPSWHSKALRKFQTLPHLRRYVRNLEIWEIHRPWIATYQDWRETLALLAPYIVSFRMYRRRWRREQPRFDCPSMSVLTSVEMISLREEDARGPRIEVYKDKALPVFLNYFPRLKKLIIEYLLVDTKVRKERKRIEMMKVWTPPPPPTFNLEMLWMGSCGDDVLPSWILPALLPLRRLRLAWRNSGISIPMSDFIDATGGQLEHLDLESLECADDAELHAFMTLLRSKAASLISISLMTSSPREPNHDTPLSVVIRALSHLNAHPHLQCITIVIRKVRLLVTETCWNGLDAILSDTVRFPALIDVTFQLSSESSGPSTSPFSVDDIDIPSFLPQLSSRGILSILAQISDNALYYQ